MKDLKPPNKSPSIKSQSPSIKSQLLLAVIVSIIIFPFLYLTIDYAAAPNYIEEKHIEIIKTLRQENREYKKTITRLEETIIKLSTQNFQEPLTPCPTTVHQAVQP